MKPSKIALTFCLLFLSVLFVKAQGKLDEASKKVTEHNASVNKKIQEINAGTSKDIKKSVEELGVELNESKKNYLDVEKKLTTAEKEKTKAQMDALKANYDKAFGFYKTMQEESVKPSANLNKIKTQAKMLSGQLKEVDKNMGALKKGI